MNGLFIMLGQNGTDMILTLKEVIRDKNYKLTEFNSSYFKSKIRPIYGETQNGRPTHIGSCTLLEVNEKKYIVTAAHVLDEAAKTTLYVGVNSKPFPLEGEFYSTKSPTQSRKDDHYDFAWKRLSLNEIEELKNVNFITTEDIILNTYDTEGHTFLALGYPNSKNKKFDHKNSIIKPNFFRYWSTVKEDKDLCNELEISGEEHLFLDYNKMSKNSDNQKVNSYKPQGISGGVLIDMGSVKNIEMLTSEINTTGKVAGILIENHRNFKTMVAVKIRIVINEILKKP